MLVSCGRPTAAASRQLRECCSYLLHDLTAGTPTTDTPSTPTTGTSAALHAASTATAWVSRSKVCCPPSPPAPAASVVHGVAMEHALLLLSSLCDARIPCRVPLQALLAATAAAVLMA